jgi:type VI secretion system secreted protein Hcp
MAVDMFMKIGDIKGESADKQGHAGEIDVLAWSWGASNSGTGHTGGGSGSGKVKVQDLSFTKWIDQSSPVLFQHCCNGKHHPEAMLVVRKAGEKPLEYMKVKMNDVMITAYSTGGSAGEDRLTENVTLNFAKVECIYTGQAKGGTGEGEVKMGWDIKGNIKV